MGRDVFKPERERNIEKFHEADRSLESARDLLWEAGDENHPVGDVLLLARSNLLNALKVYGSIYSALTREPESRDKSLLWDHLKKVAPAVNYVSKTVSKGIEHTMASANLTGILADVSLGKLDYTDVSPGVNRWVGENINPIISEVGRDKVLKLAQEPRSHRIRHMHHLSFLRDSVQNSAAYFGEGVVPVVENGIVQGYAQNCGSRQLGITSCPSQDIHTTERLFDVACAYKDTQHNRRIAASSEPADTPCGGCAHYALCSASYDLADEKHPFSLKNVRTDGVDKAGLLKTCIGHQIERGSAPAVTASYTVIDAIAESGRELYQSLSHKARTSTHGEILCQIAGDPKNPNVLGNLEALAGAFEVVLTTQLRPPPKYAQMAGT